MCFSTAFKPQQMLWQLSSQLRVSWGGTWSKARQLKRLDIVLTLKVQLTEIFPYDFTLVHVLGMWQLMSEYDLLPLTTALRKLQTNECLSDWSFSHTHLKLLEDVNYSCWVAWKNLSSNFHRVSDQNCFKGLMNGVGKFKIISKTQRTRRVRWVENF